VWTSDDRRPRRADRPRRRAGRAGVEALEGRELLAFTSLGFSLPDLTVRGQAGPVAAYGGTVAVTVDVANLGASSLIEPLAMTPGAPSTADAPASTVEVLFSPRADGRRAIRLGSIAVPPVPQNDVVRVTGEIALPAIRPRGFPDLGQTGFLFFDVDRDVTFRDFDRTNNRSAVGAPVTIFTALPELEAIALEVPTTLNPGDAIAPSFRIANFGAADTIVQAPLLVQIVASQDRTFGPGDLVLASFVIDNVAPLSDAPTKGPVLGDVTLDPPPNVVTILGPQLILPSLPTTYFLGLAVDPNNAILEISEIGRGPDPRLEQLRAVGPDTTGLPPAGILGPPGDPANVFPIPPFGPLIDPPVDAIVDELAQFQSSLRSQRRARFLPAVGATRRAPLVQRRRLGFLGNS